MAVSLIFLPSFFSKLSFRDFTCFLRDGIPQSSLSTWLDQKFPLCLWLGGGITPPFTGEEDREIAGMFPYPPIFNGDAGRAI